MFHNVNFSSLCFLNFALTLQHPTILIAGEAAHESHFSTTHGAFESGQSQARKLVDYRKGRKLKAKHYCQQ